MKRVVLSLGSNLQNRQEYLLKSAKLIDYRIGNIVNRSRIYETESWGFSSFPFLNQVLIINTDFTPEEVLTLTQTIEKELGRTHKTDLSNNPPQYQARTIDIDILLYDNAILRTHSLTIPHPHIQEREFVLLPLSELFQNEIIPPFQQSFQQLLLNVQQSKVS